MKLTRTERSPPIQPGQRVPAQKRHLYPRAMKRGPHLSHNWLEPFWPDLGACNGPTLHQHGFSTDHLPLKLPQASPPVFQFHPGPASIYESRTHHTIWIIMIPCLMGDLKQAATKFLAFFLCITQPIQAKKTAPESHCRRRKNSFDDFFALKRKRDPRGKGFFPRYLPPPEPG